MSDGTRALALVLTGAVESRGPPRQSAGLVRHKRAKIPLDKQHGIFDTFRSASAAAKAQAVGRQPHHICPQFQHGLSLARPVVLQW
jgi:hypothetical protein